MQALLAAGADVNAPSRAPSDFKRENTPDDPIFGHTPLMVAADNDDLEMLKTLLAAGANLNINGGTYNGGTKNSSIIIIEQADKVSIR